jgi:hypothetical protein
MKSATATTLPTSRTHGEPKKAERTCRIRDRLTLPHIIVGCLSARIGCATAMIPK